MTLPAYPYQRQRYWLDSFQEPAPAQHSPANAGFTLTEVDSPALRGRAFEALVDLRNVPFLADHRIAGAPVFPLTGFIDLALRAAQQCRLGRSLGLEDLTVVQPLILNADQPVRLQVAIEADSLRVYSIPGRVAVACICADRSRRVRRHAGAVRGSGSLGGSRSGSVL